MKRDLILLNLKQSLATTASRRPSISPRYLFYVEDLSVPQEGQPSSVWDLPKPLSWVHSTDDLLDSKRLLSVMRRNMSSWRYFLVTRPISTCNYFTVRVTSTIKFMSFICISRRGSSIGRLILDTKWQQLVKSNSMTSLVFVEAKRKLACYLVMKFV